MTTRRRGPWRVAAVLTLASLLVVGAVRGDDATTVAPAGHVRTPDQTFLTFPEWYLVHSPAEYAAYLARAVDTGTTSSGFPFFAHVGQFWQSYAAVTREIARYPFNGGYHLMVIVIGASTTVEYALKGVYERTVGRIAEATRSQRSVPEERFAADYARAYVDFIRVDPWYRFDFASRLRTLWHAVPLDGPDAIRRWERRFALTSELLVKAAYARLIALGTASIYDAPQPVTAVLLTRAPVRGLDEHRDFHVLRDAGPAGLLATVPRYEGFTTYGRWLADDGIDFVEIAGNRGDIVVSFLVHDERNIDGARLLFEQPILTRPGTRRVVVAMPVAMLADHLRRADAAGDRVTVEHVYDF